MYEAVWRGQRVAVKCLPSLTDGLSGSSGTPQQFEALVREIELSVRFNSPCLVKVRRSFFGFCSNTIHQPDGPLSAHLLVH